MADSNSSRFLVSARKYRPQTFDDLVAQEHVTATLRNAIRLDRLAHAYLFSGPRGVGKTTAARLLAKAINCETPLEQRENAEPCRQCTSCRAFEEGRDLNVIEMDAASNNSVDDIRDLRETVRVPPQGARKKVYILDEVHMLSTQAFNAFLKTLEEPPPHALFIFATTEPHKVLPTILSRCQRFDFRRIAIDDTVGRLREICDHEGIDADDASLHLIAKKGDGALRDALSLFDQAVALCGTTLRYDELALALGVVTRDLYFDVVAQARSRDTAGLLRLVDNIIRRGYDLAEFMAGLTEHIRHLYVAVSTREAGLIEADPATRQRFLESSEGLAEADLLRMMTVVEEAERTLRSSAQPRLSVELALLKLAHLESVSDLRQLIAKLEHLEEMARAGKLPAATAAPESAPPRQQPPETPAPRPSPATTAEPDPSYRRHRSDDDDGGIPTEPPSPPPPSPPRTSAPAPASPAPHASEAPSSPDPDSFFGRPALQKPRREGRGDGSPDNAAVAVAAANTRGEIPLRQVREAWPQLVTRVSARSTRLGSCLAAAAPEGVHREAVAVAVPDAFSQQMLNDEGAILNEELRALLGHEPPPLTFVVRPPGAETVAQSDPFEVIKQLRQEHPTVRMLFERFGAEIVWS